MTAPATTPFPERMRTMVTKNHAASAAKALDDIAEQAASLKRDLLNDRALSTGEIARLAGLVTTAAVHLSALEEQREVRRWDEAERQGQ